MYTIILKVDYLSNGEFERSLYRKKLKNREFSKEISQNFDSEQMTIAAWRGLNESQNSAVKPTPPKSILQLARPNQFIPFFE